jgi:hypothetical protein
MAIAQWVAEMINLTCRDSAKIGRFSECMKSGAVYTECGVAYLVTGMFCMSNGERNVRGGWSSPPVWEVTLVPVSEA